MDWLFLFVLYSTELSAAIENPAVTHVTLQLSSRWQHSYMIPLLVQHMNFGLLLKNNCSCTIYFWMLCYENSLWAASVVAKLVWEK